MKPGDYEAGPECMSGGNGRSPRKPADHRHRPARFPREEIREWPRRKMSRGGVVVRLLASHRGEPGLIPGGVAPGFSHVGIVSDDAAGRRVFSGIFRLPRSCIPVPLHIHLALTTSALKTSIGLSSRVVKPCVADLICTVQRYDGNTARLARRSDEALGVRVSVARIASSLFDLGRGVPTASASGGHRKFTLRTALRPTGLSTVRPRSAITRSGYCAEGGGPD
ncbi:hypothetical protein PR048_017653 [Dryococelus australis]|uniref:Uncharacterized protein n=1 Tax=Dryococelus australis TaxID=614101 RepID=A0ABQ9HA72_9NEOP|nr:hypothetical protein PR048_017653 [Dryococelus australis]